MNIELLSWLSNFVNFTILAYISLNIVNSNCFNVFQMSLSIIGLVASIFVSMVSIYLKVQTNKLK